MVQLTITSAAQSAIVEYCRVRAAKDETDGEATALELDKLLKADIGSPVDHHELVEISKYLIRQSKDGSESIDGEVAKAWRLDTLLKGATVYRSFPPPSKEPVSAA